MAAVKCSKEVVQLLVVTASDCGVLGDPDHTCVPCACTNSQECVDLEAEKMDVQVSFFSSFLVTKPPR